MTNRIAGVLYTIDPEFKEKCKALSVITVKVTQEAIDKGEKCKAEVCAIAVSFDLVPFITVSVNKLQIEFMCEEGWFYVRNPEFLRKWIVAFDEGHKVEPFEFDVEIPTYFLSHTKESS